jgi:hypothetical protein
MQHLPPDVVDSVVSSCPPKSPFQASAELDVRVALAAGIDSHPFLQRQIVDKMMSPCIGFDVTSGWAFRRLSPCVRSPYRLIHDP